ncbi:DUF4350 domain-containing protein [Sanguibacter hominis ATCC BAA-789]|uniref:DUF4350 domain-containing protein n=1 Tax=Sanguibacter hominis ATCC BAA-789 TaxID=1312740 RepID=A0A9X5FCR7_9MICO|nr:DUF4350 domain-containing protein [Sanguibacter hominis]NKX93759.1 DUF4350 domain-containing protein [Sanguibacter hominis ATCC BAA-789]
MTVPPPHAPVAEAPLLHDMTPGLPTDDAAPVPAARTTWRARLSRARWPLAVVGALVVGSLVFLLVTPSTSSTPYAPDNPDPGGAMALAAVLRGEGVEVSHVRATADLEQRARTGTTVLVLDDYLMTPEAREVLLASGADLVLADPQSDLVSEASDGRITRPNQSIPATVLDAGCTDPDAAAAGPIRAGGRGFTGDPSTSLCFPTGATGSAGEPLHAVASATRPDGSRVTALSSADLLTNAEIIDEGNAALALRVLGRTGSLVWYQPLAVDDTADGADVSILDLLPGPAAQLLWLAAGVLGVAIVWRGRQLGPVVAEPLPVVVHAGEATRGRARLYRRGRAHGHAGAALRAGTADRLARRTGLPRSASGPQVVDAVCRATGRRAADVGELLYGPPPADDAALVRLTQMLDQLESEVDRT